MQVARMGRPEFQSLDYIPLIPRTGEERLATRNGNNAAWLCCGEEPLLGAGLPGNRDKLVKCRRCGDTLPSRVWRRGKRQEQAGPSGGKLEPGWRKLPKFMTLSQASFFFPAAQLP